MSREEQANAIMQAIGLPLVNDQFASFVGGIMRLAILAFDGANLGEARAEGLNGWSPQAWALFKGEMELALLRSELHRDVQDEWRIAFKAAYRITGSEYIAPDYRGVV